MLLKNYFINFEIENMIRFRLVISNDLFHVWISFGKKIIKNNRLPSLSELTP